MQRATIIATLGAALSLSACAYGPPLTTRARHVQIQKQNSALLGQCHKLGPVSATSGVQFNRISALDVAEVRLRNKVAAMGGDTLVIVHKYWDYEGRQTNLKVQGVAMNCYGAGATGKYPAE